MKSACCASSMRDHTGWESAITRAGTRAAPYARISGCRATDLNVSARISFGVDAQDAEEEASEYRLHAESEQHGGCDYLTHRRPRVERPEPDRLPRDFFFNDTATTE